MEELTVEEIIKYAIRIERESYQFYRHASKFLEGNKLKSLTEELAQQEVDHVNQLKGLLDEKKITDEDLIYLVDVDTSLFTRIIATTQVPAQASPLDILCIALDREKNTLKNYEMLLTITTLHKELIKTLKLLKGMEEVHIEKIADRITEMRARH